MNYPFVSFVVPVYNASKYLKHCVESLLSQTFKDIEIILVDDGATDGSSAICDDLLLTDDRVRVVHQKNHGVSVARNEGIKVSGGKYISFVDADDWMDHNVCEVFFNACKKQDYDLFCFSAIYDSQKKKVHSFLFSDDVELLSQKQKAELLCKAMAPWAPWYSFNCNTRFAGSVWARFYRAEILKKQNLMFSSETIISEDVLFNVLALDHFEKIGYFKDIFYHYRQSQFSAQNRYRKDSEKYFIFIIRKINDWLKLCKKERNFMDAANCLFVHYLFGVLKEDVFHKDNPELWPEKKEKLNRILQKKEFSDSLENMNFSYFSFAEYVLVFLLKHRFFNVIRLVFKFF